MGSDRDISSFDERLLDHVKKKHSNYERIRIDLSVARNYHLYDVAGEFITIERQSSEIAAAELTFDLPNRDVINLGEVHEVQTVFEKFYISNAAQSGQWFDLIIGRNFKSISKRIERGGSVQQVLNVTHANPNTNVACAAQSCKAAHIKADVNNTQTAWIDFGVAAVQNSALPLDPGEWVIFPMSNTNVINANFEVGGEIVFVTPVQ